MVAFVDHGKDGTGVPLTVLFRAGNAGSNTAVDHISVARAAFKSLPACSYGGVRVVTGTRPGALLGADGLISPALTHAVASAAGRA